MTPPNDSPIQIAALEYDVRGLGATEASPLEENQMIIILISYLPAVD